MPKIKDLATVVGTYEKNGETRKRYLTVGAIMSSSDGGQFILLDPLVNFGAIPRKEGSDRVLISMFDVKEKSVHGDEQYQHQTSAHNAAKANGYVNDPAMQGPLDDGSDIPFN